MNKKVLILSGSPRKGGNSDLLCDEFMRGTVEAGNEAIKIRVAEKKIGFCSACYYCRQSGGVCAKKDDIYAFIRRGFPGYMFMQTMFAFFDYGEPKLYFFADYLAIMVLFAICGHYAALLLKRNNVVKG